MIQATQMKRGMCIKHENELYRVVETQHKTPGNLRGFVQVNGLGRKKAQAQWPEPWQQRSGVAS